MLPIDSSALLLIAATITTASGSSSTSRTGWRDDLPWANLTAKLSEYASLIDVSHHDYVKDCFEEFTDFSYSERTNHQLIDKTSGLCLPHLFCGWENCYPRPSVNGHSNETAVQWLQDVAFSTTVEDSSIEDFRAANPTSFLNDACNPSLNLPPKVLFPVVASDVVAAIQFAKNHRLEISVKNSGHHYAGASQKKDSLLLNMNRYTPYAPTGITDCDESKLDGSIAADLSDQPCFLSLAKKKSAYVRVSGGENWDKVYRAVRDKNKAQEQEGGEYKYHVVGGAAGTVSPLGWTFQGGLSGTTGSRLYGLGVDQVLQLEMVLPNGHHVRFGPTDWEDASADGFLVPRTLNVSGVCRSNPEEQDEKEWEWGSCPADFDVDFNDLWFAVRGGGGGTWGVVTSLYLQLHDYLRYEVYGLVCEALTSTWIEFRSIYIMAPSMLNVTSEHSHACGIPSGDPRMHCYGEEEVEEAWARFLVWKNVNVPDLPDVGGCLAKFGSGAGMKSFADLAVAMGEKNPRIGSKAPDAPPPAPASGSLWLNNVLVPSQWIEASEENFKFVMEGVDGMYNYYAFGGAVPFASDQANSLSQAHRDAGMMIFFDKWIELVPNMFDISDTTNFPPMFGSNHAGSFGSGPRKDNWTETCPWDWTFEKRAAECISVQEAIYGTKVLKRLEAIKEAVDPNYMFDCNRCIGNNRPKAIQNDTDVSAQGKKCESEISSAASITKSLSIVTYLVVGWIGFPCIF